MRCFMSAITRDRSIRCGISWGRRRRIIREPIGSLPMRRALDAENRSCRLYEALGAERLLDKAGKFHGGYGWGGLQAPPPRCPLERPSRTQIPCAGKETPSNPPTPAAGFPPPTRWSAAFTQAAAR